ncbi:hypothetical protein HDU85_000353 [Gaertneriomyces sp. JEL0708]|nr:hypothetical protein HDU85_000353 [Gaertneriomyces sp. JEL0708]
MAERAGDAADCSSYTGGLVTLFNGVALGVVLASAICALSSRYRIGNAAAAMMAVNRDALLSKTGQKMVLLVNSELKMGKGKIAAQCGHATLGCYLEAIKTPARARSMERWLATGQKKVALKCESELEMLTIAEKARQKALPVKVVRDSGRTQIPSGSRTVVAIAGPEEMVTELTGHLKLL